MAAVGYHGGDYFGASLYGSPYQETSKAYDKTGSPAKGIQLLREKGDIEK